MKTIATKRDLWNEGSKAGVVLGIIPVIYMLLTNAIAGMEGHAVLAAVLNFLLWAIKFGLCLWLMYFFMKKFADKYAVDNALTFKYGVVIALCSALIVSVCNLAYILFINPDIISQQMDAVVSSYSSMLDSNTMQALDKVEAMMPQITFFSNLIWCFLFGTLVSLIYSRNIPPRNPFATTEDLEDQQDNDQNGNEIQ